MAHKRALKPKDIERMRELVLKHPGDLFVDEQKELAKLQKLQSKYGQI